MTEFRKKKKKEQSLFCQAHSLSCARLQHVRLHFLSLQRVISLLHSLFCLHMCSSFYICFVNNCFVYSKTYISKIQLPKTPPTKLYVLLTPNACFFSVAFRPLQGFSNALSLFTLHLSSKFTWVSWLLCNLLRDLNSYLFVLVTIVWFKKISIGIYNQSFFYQQADVRLPRF